MRRATLLAVLAVVVGVSAAAAQASIKTTQASTPRADSHDRALVKQLGAKVATFRAVAAKRSDGNELQSSLDNCPALKKDPSKAFAAVFALLPVLVIDLVNQYGPELTDVRNTLAGMHAHQPLFDQWLRTQTGTFDSILALNNHGKKIDYCNAATVMLDKKSTAADIRGALGVDVTAIAKLFTPTTAASGAALTKMNLKLRPFFVSAGLSPKIAKSLTS